MKKMTVLALLLFLPIAFLRLWRLDKVPIALFGDEIDVGLQAYSISETGRDYFGNRLPVLFHSFAEYRLPMQLYLDAPFIKILGLTELGVRAPSVVMGLISIIAIFFLVRKIFDEKVAVVSAIFLSLSPWHFIYSRQANDAGILLPFILLGTLFFVKGMESYKFLFLSSLFFCLGIYTYYPASAFVPLFIILLVLVYRKKILGYGAQKIGFLFLATLIILSPYLTQFISGRATERFSYISVAPENKSNERGIAERVFKNYSKSFSFSFLFSEGDPNPRQSVDGWGLLYRFDLIFILFGLFNLIRSFAELSEERKKLVSVLGLWLLVAPLPSSLTEGGGTHASRLILMLAPLTVLSALGFMLILNGAKNFKSKLIVGVLLLFMAFEVVRFFQSYFTLWPKESWRLWQSGFKEAISFVKANEGGYQKVILNNTYEPMLPRFLFWYGYDMALFQKTFDDDKHIQNIYPSLNGFKLGDKFYFGELVKPIENLAKEDNLVVASAEKDVTNPTIFEDSELKLLNVIYSPEKTPIFYIYTQKK